MKNYTIIAVPSNDDGYTRVIPNVHQNDLVKIIVDAMDGYDENYIYVLKDSYLIIEYSVVNDACVVYRHGQEESQSPENIALADALRLEASIILKEANSIIENRRILREQMIKEAEQKRIESQAENVRKQKLALYEQLKKELGI